MKKFIYGLFIISFALNLHAARLDVGQDRIVKVNDKIITVKELEKYYNQMSKILPPDQRPSKNFMLTALIQQALLKEEIEKTKTIVLNDQLFEQTLNQQKQSFIQYKTQKDPNYKLQEGDFKKFVEEEMKVTYEEYEGRLKDSVLINQFVMKKAEEKIQNIATKRYDSPNDFPVFIPDYQNGGVNEYNSLSEFYDQNPSEFLKPKHVELKHIYKMTIMPGENNKIISIPDAEKEIKKKALEDVYTRLQNGESFDKLCELFSDDVDSRDYKDPKTGDYNRGYIGGVFISGPTAQYQKQQFGPIFNQLFELKKGEYSRVLESNVGYHIFYVVDKKEAGMVPFEDTVEELRELFRQFDREKTISDELDSTVEELQNKASIVYYSDEYKPN